MDKLLLTPTEAATALGIGRSKVYELGTLGHSRLATTNDLYTHLLEPVQRAAADRMDDLLRQVTPGSGA